MDERIAVILEQIGDRLEKQGEVLETMGRAIVRLETRQAMTEDHERRLRDLEADSVRIKTLWAVIAAAISLIVSFVVNKFGG